MPSKPNERSRNNSRIKRLLRSVSRFNLTLRIFECKLTGDDYTYRVFAAKRASGSRGGRMTHVRNLYFTNLYPDQRADIRSIPTEPGFEHQVSQR